MLKNDPVKFGNLLLALPTIKRIDTLALLHLTSDIKYGFRVIKI